MASYCRNKGTGGRIGKRKRLKYQENKNNGKRRRIKQENR